MNVYRKRFSYKLYSFVNVESYVQKYWDDNHSYIVTENTSKEKFYCLSMMPYPSGDLHMGHVRNYTIGDVISRYQRMLGKNVLHPMGWDAFGLPAELAAIKNNIHPYKWIRKNIFCMKKQLKRLGFSYDWSREIVTCSPEYYRWEQWFFIKLYTNGLVYKKNSWVNWCSYDNTVLANEQVVDGNCWLCNNLVKKKKIMQWFLRITRYAKELLDDLNLLHDWPEEVKDMQRNWIGCYKVVQVFFCVYLSNDILKSFVVDVNELLQVTYLIIDVHHDLVCKLLNSKRNIKKFVNRLKGKNIKKDFLSIEDQDAIFTELYVVHPLTGHKIPIMLVDDLVDFSYYDNNNVLLGIPVKDKIYYKFAKKHKLPLCLDLSDFNVKNKNNDSVDKLSCKFFFKKLFSNFIKQGVFEYTYCYRLRDWVVSRQRYWGVLIPMMTSSDNKIYPVSVKELPITLPLCELTKNKFYNPLKKVDDLGRLKITNNGKLFYRETDTLDTFIESSWYYARYTCVDYNHGMVNKSSANYWLPVDQYIGGIEHAVMHLMYFRFYHKLMRDFGFVSCDEPVKRLLCQGMVLADSFYYIDSLGKKHWVPLIEIKKTIRNNNGDIIKAVDFKGRDLVYNGMIKMSKSKNNGVSPDVIIDKYGADSLRLFIMFAAPPEKSIKWNEGGVVGMSRFLNRLWNIVYKHNHVCSVFLDYEDEISFLEIKKEEFWHKINKTILKVTKDIDCKQSFNTAISSIMKLLNYLDLFYKKNKILNKVNYILLQTALIILIKLLYPFAPHICFVLWNFLGNNNNIEDSSWPVVNKKFLNFSKNFNRFISVFINGKLCTKINVPISADEILIKDIVFKTMVVKKYFKNRYVEKVIYVDKKLINFVLK